MSALCQGLRECYHTGASFLDAADVPSLAAAAPHGDFATADLFQNIQAGDYPVWRLCIQTLDPRRVEDYDFYPLDATKVAFPGRQ